MKKLHFKFLDGKDILIDNFAEYSLKKGLYNFKIGDYKFILELEPALKIRREDDDSIFELVETAKHGIANYELKNPNLKVEIKLKYFKVIKSEKEYIIEYIIESDEKNIKTICISI